MFHPSICIANAFQLEPSWPSSLNFGLTEISLFTAHSKLCPPRSQSHVLLISSNRIGITYLIEFSIANEFILESCSRVLSKKDFFLKLSPSRQIICASSSSPTPSAPTSTSLGLESLIQKSSLTDRWNWKTLAGENCLFRDQILTAFCLPYLLFGDDLLAETTWPGITLAHIQSHPTATTFTVSLISGFLGEPFELLVERYCK